MTLQLGIKSIMSSDLGCGEVPGEHDYCSVLVEVRVVLERGRRGPRTMHRFKDAGEHYSDTWRQDLPAAFPQPRFAYSLDKADFVVVDDTEA